MQMQSPLPPAVMFAFYYFGYPLLCRTVFVQCHILHKQETGLASFLLIYIL